MRHQEKYLTPKYMDSRSTKPGSLNMTMMQHTPRRTHSLLMVSFPEALRALPVLRGSKRASKAVPPRSFRTGALTGLGVPCTATANICIASGVTEDFHGIVEALSMLPGDPLVLILLPPGVGFEAENGSDVAVGFDAEKPDGCGVTPAACVLPLAAAPGVASCALGGGVAVAQLVPKPTIATDLADLGVVVGDMGPSKDW